MKILFKNVTRYTKEEINRFQKFHNNKNATEYKVFVISVVILFVCFTVLNTIYQNLRAVIGTIAISIVLYMYYFRVNPSRKKKNNQNQLETEFTFCFTNKDILIRANGAENKMPYFKIHKVYETDSNFYIYIDDEYSILINKSGFIKGNVEDFRKFIKKKVILKYKSKLFM